MLMKLGSVLFVLPGVLLLWLYNTDLNTIEICQAAEQYYDAASASCVAEYRPTSSYYVRHSGLVNYGMLASVVGILMMTWGMVLKGLTRAPEDRPPQ